MGSFFQYPFFKTKAVPTLQQQMSLERSDAIILYGVFNSTPNG